jgi:hypothetical protein
MPSCRLLCYRGVLTLGQDNLTCGKDRRARTKPRRRSHGPAPYTNHRSGEGKRSLPEDNPASTTAGIHPRWSPWGGSDPLDRGRPRHLSPFRLYPTGCHLSLANQVSGQPAEPHNRDSESESCGLHLHSRHLLIAIVQSGVQGNRARLRTSITDRLGLRPLSCF